MTVITIVLIGVVAAVGLILIPRLMDGVQKRSACTEYGGTIDGNKCRFNFDHPKHHSYCTMGKCAANSKHPNEWMCAVDCND